MKRILVTLAVMTLTTLAYGQSVFNCSSFTSSGACAVANVSGGGGSAFGVFGTFSGTTPALSGGVVTLLTSGANHAALSMNYQTQVNVQAFTASFTFVPNGQNVSLIFNNTNNQAFFNGAQYSAGAGCEADFFQAFYSPAPGPPNNVFALELDNYSPLLVSNPYTYTNSSAQIYSAGTSPCIPNDGGNTFPQINKISTSPISMNSPATTQNTTTGHTYSASVGYDGSNFSLCLYDVTAATGSCSSSTSGTGTFFQHTWTGVNIPSIVGGNTAWVGMGGASGSLVPPAALKVGSFSYSVGTPPSSLPLWNGLLASTRAPGTAWQTAGAGTLPTRSTCTTLGTAGQSPTFPQSVTVSQINTALASCPANEQVLLNPGTYTMAGTILPTSLSNRSLVGSGANQTILKFTTTSSNCSGSGGGVAVCIYNGDSGALNDSANQVSVSSGVAQGSTSIVLASTTNLHVGSLLSVNQLDDSNTDNGNWWECGTPVSPPTAYCTWGGISSAFPGRQLTQIVTVTNISGTTVTFSPGLYGPKWSQSKSPMVTYSSTLPITGFGLESLTVDVSSVGAMAAPVEFLWAQNSWVKGVKTVNNTVTGSSALVHHFIAASSHITVRDSYMYGANPQNSGYGIDFLWGTSDSLAENNIGHHMPTAYITETAMGNVFGYNFATDNFFGGGTQQCDVYHHGGGDTYNLVEGQYGICAYADDAHGTSFGLNYFRNYWSGFDTATTCPGGGNSCGTGPGAKNLNTFAYADQAFARYNDLVANVLGNGTYQHTYQNQGASGSPNSCPGFPQTVIYSLNFAAGAAQQPFSPSCIQEYSPPITLDNDPLVSSTLMRWGNYDTVNGAVRTVSGENGSGAPTYPALASPSSSWASYPSLYLSAQPSWWGTMPWPAIGPDVSGGNVANVGGHVYLTPAANCYYNVMGGQDDGSSGPLNFNASTCYTSTPTAAAPTFSPVSGTYTSTQSVAISTATSGATICYTTDGSAPTTASAGTCGSSPTQTYSGAISVSSTTTIRALATKSGLTDSAVTGGTWTITLPTLAAPTFSPAGGTFLTLPSVTPTLPSGAKGCYTTDGSSPAASTPGTCSHGSTWTSGTIAITTSGTTLKMIATEASFINSSETDATYFQAPIILESSSFFNTSGGFTTVTLPPQAVSAGDGITVEVKYSCTTSVVSVTDNVNTGVNYTPAVAMHDNTSVGAQVGTFFLFGSSGSSSVLQVTLTLASSCAHIEVQSQAWKPLVGGTFTLDSSTVQQQDVTGPNPTTGSTVTPTHAEEVIVGTVLASTQTPTPGAGWTAANTTLGPQMFPEYQVQVAATPVNAPQTMTSDSWTDQQAGFYFGTSVSPPTGLSVIIAKLEENLNETLPIRSSTCADCFVTRASTALSNDNLQGVR